MITILPAIVRILHFPRSYIPFVSHAITKACFFTKTNDPRYFFSFTENAHEVSIVANDEVIEQDFMPVLKAAQCMDSGMSPDVFRVLQAEEGSQDSSGTRIDDLSAPLAEGKFSIFYMSTYQTDFVLIKDRRLHQAVQLLKGRGFEFDEPADDIVRGGSAEESYGSIESTSSYYQPPDLSSTVLDNEVRCVGLNPHYRSEWAMTLLKVLCYPDQIVDSCTRFFSYTATSDGGSMIADERFLSLFPEQTIFCDEDSPKLRVIQVSLAGTNLDRCGIVRSISYPLTREANINLLYLSTFESANVLVLSDDLPKVEHVLGRDLDKLRTHLAEVVLDGSQ